MLQVIGPLGCPVAGPFDYESLKLRVYLRRLFIISRLFVGVGFFGRPEC